MGRCLSTPPKEVTYITSKSQSELMLQRSSSFNEQLRIIIDTDRYKPSQPHNHSKYCTLGSVEHSHSNGTEISVSHTHSHSHSQSSSLGIIPPPNGAVTLMGFASSNSSSNCNNATAVDEQSEHTAKDADDDNDDKQMEESKSQSEDSEPSMIQTKSVTLMGIASPNEVVLSSNLDLNNRNSLLMQYLDIPDTVNPSKPVVKETVTSGC